MKSSSTDILTKAGRALVSLLVLLIVSSCMLGDRPFPKRYLGTYSGEQAAYSAAIDGESMSFEPITYELELTYDELWLSTAQRVLHGTYSVTADTDRYYAIRVKLENGVIEEWQIMKSDEKLIRKAIEPEPEVIFVQED